MKNLKNMIIAISMLICAQGAYALSQGRELFEAVRNDDFTTVQQLLRNPDIDIDWANKDNMYMTPLMEAALLTNIVMIKLLLNAGANPEKTTPAGQKALNFAEGANGEKDSDAYSILKGVTHPEIGKLEMPIYNRDRGF